MEFTREDIYNMARCYDVVDDVAKVLYGRKKVSVEYIIDMLPAIKSMPSDIRIKKLETELLDAISCTDLSFTKRSNITLDASVLYAIIATLVIASTPETEVLWKDPIIPTAKKCYYVANRFNHSAEMRDAFNSIRGYNFAVKHFITLAKRKSMTFGEMPAYALKLRRSAERKQKEIANTLLTILNE